MHKLLERQLRWHRATTTEPPADWSAFLQAVDNAYEAAQADRALSERSMQLASEELFERNEQLRRDLSERERLQTELQHAHKLEAVGQLAAGIAHEINTPTQFLGDSLAFIADGLTACTRALEAHARLRDAARVGPVSGEEIEAVDELEAELDLSYTLAALPDAIERAQEGVRRIARIVGAMREFAHPDSAEKTPVDLNRAILSTLVVAQHELKYVADVETDLGDLPPVVCHPGDINQVFLNLLVNAAHAIGSVVSDSGGRGTIRVRSYRDGPMAVVAVADTGCGIPESIRLRVFDLFFTTKEVGRGTGQGLAIARSIVVDKHGGTLTFESEVGRGTTFRMGLPFEPLRTSVRARSPS